MGKKVEFEQFDPHIGIFEGYTGWRLLLQQPLGTNRVSQAKMLTEDLLLRIAIMLMSRRVYKIWVDNAATPRYKQG